MYIYIYLYIYIYIYMYIYIYIYSMYISAGKTCKDIWPTYLVKLHWAIVETSSDAPPAPAKKLGIMPRVLCVVHFKPPWVKAMLLSMDVILSSDLGKARWQRGVWNMGPQRRSWLERCTRATHIYRVNHLGPNSSTKLIGVDLAPL